jgi:aspartate oxidase
VGYILCQLDLAFSENKPFSIRYNVNNHAQQFMCHLYNMSGRECCKWLVKRLDENIRILQQFKINELIFGEKIKLKVYVNQHDFVSDIQTPSRS